MSSRLAELSSHVLEWFCHAFIVVCDLSDRRFSRLFHGHAVGIRPAVGWGVDGRIVIVALYQFHIAGVRAIFASGHASMCHRHEACRRDHGFMRSCSRFEAREEAGQSAGFADFEILSV